jgi:hypothetical protein
VGGCACSTGATRRSHTPSARSWFRFLEEINGLPPGDPWFARLRDAYLEPWGRGLTGTFVLALRVGTFAHTFAWARQRDHLPAQARPEFDTWFAVVLRRALANTIE